MTKLRLPSSPLAIGLVAALALGAAAWAQGADYELPAFTGSADAGAPGAPTPPPPPPAEVTGVTPDGGATAPDGGAPPTPSPPPPVFGPFSGHLGVTLAGSQFVQVGVEAALGKVFGQATPVAGRDWVEGWVVVPSVEASFGRIGTGACAPTLLCGSRFTVGPSVKAGWASGVPGLGGWTRLQTMYFAQLGVLFGYAWIPSAPLAPGDQTAELVLRGRVGLHWSRLGSATVSAKSGTVMAAAFVEGIPAAGFTRGVVFGASLGLGF